VSLENLVTIKDDVFEQYKNSKETVTTLQAQNSLQFKKLSELELVLDTDAKKSLKLTQTVATLTEHLQEKNQVSP
jgi:hypothetical protein